MFNLRFTYIEVAHLTLKDTILFVSKYLTLSVSACVSVCYGGRGSLLHATQEFERLVEPSYIPREPSTLTVSAKVSSYNTCSSLDD